LEARIRRTLRRMRGERVRGRAGHGGVMMIVLLLFLQKQNLCAACPAHSEAPPRSDARSDCVCSLGFSGPAGGPCAECPANAYADALNMSACTACLANSDSPILLPEAMRRRTVCAASASTARRAGPAPGRGFAWPDFSKAHQMADSLPSLQRHCLMPLLFIYISVFHFRRSDFDCEGHTGVILEWRSHGACEFYSQPHQVI